MKSAGWVACVSMVLAGCGGAHVPDDEEADFGAGVVARYVIAAQQKCDAAGTPDLYECAEASPSATGERLAARSALDVYRIFQQNCYENAGAGKCEALLEAACQKTEMQETRRLRSDVKKPPEGG